MWDPIPFMTLKHSQDLLDIWVLEHIGVGELLLVLHCIEDVIICDWTRLCHFKHLLNNRCPSSFGEGDTFIALAILEGGTNFIRTSDIAEESLVSLDVLAIRSVACKRRDRGTVFLDCCKN
jgi:hypothetical protein